MSSEDMIHKVVVDHLKQRLSRDYKEIVLNPKGSPDLILSNHGLVLAMVEVETEKSITAQRADEWKMMTASGVKLILVVPKNAKVRAMEILWQKKLADKVSVGSYEISINMP